jgi:hypothetical protein
VVEGGIFRIPGRLGELGTYISLLDFELDSLAGCLLLFWLSDLSVCLSKVDFGADL